MTTMMAEMRRLQQEYARERDGARDFAGVFPAVNIYDDGESLLVRAEVPGIDKSKLEITTKGNQVSIRGERTLRTSSDGAAYHRRERELGTFHRVVNLPEQIEGAKVVASYKNGVLEVLCPRAEAAKARRVQIG
jgi:HSP20 family protein